jgi:ribosome-interacting GTPase 1
LISTIPKHKGTDKLRAGLRRKLSKLKSSAQSNKSLAAKQKSVFNIGKEGSGQAVLIGAPNTGKSSLLTALTNARPKIDVFPQTTWEPTPGMMEYEDIQIQLIDTPPITRDYTDPELFNLLFRADILLIVVDIQGHPELQLRETIDILRDHRILPAHLSGRQNVPQQKITYKTCRLVVNKYDSAELEEILVLLMELLEEEWPVIRVSSHSPELLQGFRKALFDALGIIRIYSKSPGRKPDLSQPFVLKKGDTVEEFARRVHKDFVRQMKTARVWGTGVFEGQPVPRNHELHDGDVVELHL